MQLNWDNWAVIDVSLEIVTLLSIKFKELVLLSYLGAISNSI